MNNICPSCEKETKIKKIIEKETIDVRGVPIEVDSEYYVCEECNQAFENTRGYDSLEMAYREYRKRHHMLQPNEIKEWRKSYGLTQKELCQILGWGGATLSRYENGALQDDAHEKVLRLVMEPHNLRRLLEESPHALPEDKQIRLIRELTEAEEESCSFERMLEERFGNYEPSVCSGYKKFDLNKFINAVIFFCKGGQYKTKLNKLLFYADFKHYKEYTVSITGAQYLHYQFGPVPNGYEFFFAELQRDNKINLEEVAFDSYIGESLQSSVEPDFTVFSDSEIKILSEVKEKFKSFGAKEIKDFSHEEDAYISTIENEIIKYDYSRSLKI